MQVKDTWGLYKIYYGIHYEFCGNVEYIVGYLEGQNARTWKNQDVQEDGWVGDNKHGKTAETFLFLPSVWVLSVPNGYG